MISDRFSYRYRIIAFYGALNCLDYYESLNLGLSQVGFLYYPRQMDIVLSMIKISHITLIILMNLQKTNYLTCSFRLGGVLISTWGNTLLKFMGRI